MKNVKNIKRNGGTSMNLKRITALLAALALAASMAACQKTPAEPDATPSDSSAASSAAEALGRERDEGQHGQLRQGCSSGRRADRKQQEWPKRNHTRQLIRQPEAHGKAAAADGEAIDWQQALDRRQAAVREQQAQRKRKADRTEAHYTSAQLQNHDSSCNLHHGWLHTP